MHQFQDPLNKLYVRRLMENSSGDHRTLERDENGRATRLQLEPGLHVHEIEEVLLADGSIVPAELEFTARWNNGNREPVQGLGTRVTDNSGFYLEPQKIYIPAITPQASLDEWTGKPGVYKPGQDLQSLIPQGELERIISDLTEMFNDKAHWGANDHYDNDPGDQD